jgi:phage baseplate assembly protein V
VIAALLNAMRTQAQRELSESVSSRIGQVTSYNPNNYTARVTLQPDGLQTGWLPIASFWVGAGWGAYAPPVIGQMCKVQFIADDINDGVIEGRFWNNDAQPLAVPSGEYWLVHASGAFVKLTNDGKLTFSDGQGAQIQFDGAGNIDSQANQWNHTGNVTVTGDLTVTENLQVDGTATANTDVVGDGISLKSHEHSGVQGGSSNTGPPV